MGFISKVKLGFNAVKFAAKTHAPAIYLGLGVAAGVACVITACRATTKVSSIIDDAQQELAEADETLAGNVKVKDGEAYTDEDHAKDVKIIKAHAAGKLARNYAIPAALGIFAIICTLRGYKILHDRNVALSAAFNGVSAAFAKYRERVANELGADADRHFRYGDKLKFHRVVDEDGNTVDIKAEGPDSNTNTNSFDGDPVCMDFNSRTSTEFRNEWHRRPENLQRLHDVEEWTRIRVATKGHVFLNDVLEELGLAPCAMGQILGWRRRFNNDPEERFRSPDVSFGLNDIKNMVDQNGNTISGFDILHLESYPIVFNCIDIAHNPKMWERDRPYASLCCAHVKQHVW